MAITLCPRSKNTPSVINVQFKHDTKLFRQIAVPVIGRSISGWMNSLADRLDGVVERGLTYR
jgi:hypothetical protein